MLALARQKTDWTSPWFMIGISLMEAVSPKSAFTRWGLVLLGLFPCLASLGFHLIGPRSADPPPPAERPALAFDQYAVNLGPIEPMGLAKARFRFTNAGDRPVTITNLRPSCGCLQPRLEKRDYAPGETGQFFVQVATAGEQPGPRHYTISLDYLDPKPQSVVLTFRLELPPRQLYITPRALLVYQFGEESVTKEILVTDNRLNFATITGVDSPAKFIATEPAETEIDQDGIHHTRINVTISSVPLGVHDTLLKIRTDDPEFPVLNVPVRVHRQSPLIGLPNSLGDKRSTLPSDGQ